MAIEKITIQQFVELSKEIAVIDVRSESEFEHAHVPGAYNLPLFNDVERKVVGTIYKQQSREQAIKKGLEFFGPKLKNIILFAEKINSGTANTFIIHCWRGGMRSAGVAWLLDLYGFKVYTLIGGYKNFRNWVLKQFEKEYQLNVLGGYTGSGKTMILEALKKAGHCTIDLEGIAGHKGSAFGRIGLPQQSSVEMFENKLAFELYHINKYCNHKVIWIEDESQRIGSVSIPHMLWRSMRQSKVYFIDIPFKERLKYLTETYGKLNKQELAEAIKRIEKKLGGLETKMCLEFLEDDQIENCFEILLKYYDKLYSKSLMEREKTYISDSKDMMKNLYKIIIESGSVDAEVNAKKLIGLVYG